MPNRSALTTTLGSTLPYLTIILIIIYMNGNLDLQTGQRLGFDYGLPSACLPPVILLPSRSPDLLPDFRLLTSTLFKGVLFLAEKGTTYKRDDADL